MGKGKTLEFMGDNEVKYADVVSGGDQMKVVVGITGGRRTAIEPTFLIFKTQNRSYPIRGVLDNKPGVSYRSSRKGWMDFRVWCEWLTENRAMPVQSG